MTFFEPTPMQFLAYTMGLLTAALIAASAYVVWMIQQRMDHLRADCLEHHRENRESHRENRENHRENIRQMQAICAEIKERTKAISAKIDENQQAINAEIDKSRRSRQRQD